MLQSQFPLSFFNILSSLHPSYLFLSDTFFKKSFGYSTHFYICFLQSNLFFYHEIICNGPEINCAMYNSQTPLVFVWFILNAQALFAKVRYHFIRAPVCFAICWGFSLLFRRNCSNWIMNLFSSIKSWKYGLMCVG